MKLGVCTACMPEYGPPEALELLAELGYEGVSWRVCKGEGDRNLPGFWSGNRCTMTPEEIIARADELKEKSGATGVAMPSLSSYLHADQLEEIETLMRAAVAIGSGHVRVRAGNYEQNRPFPDGMRRVKEQYARVAELAEQHGVRALVETHRGHMTPSVHKAMAVLDGLDPRHVGIIWCLEGQLFEGREVYPMAIEIAGEYLAEVHVRNARWAPLGARDGQVLWELDFCPLNEGLVNWPEVLANLKEAGFDGWLLMEDFSMQRPTREKLEFNMTWFRELLSRPGSHAGCCATL